MTAVTQSIAVKAPIEKVFDAYVMRIDEWWPRQGSQFRYSFAPEGTDPDRICFDPKEGGRFFETFTNGEEFTIGTIQEYSPPHKITFTWKDPDWDSATLIEVTFKQSGEETIINLRHSGFEMLNQPGLASGYQEGIREIYGILSIWLNEHIVD